jgi:predicted nucleotidyltransferase
VITTKNVTDIATAIAAFEPDIAIALGAYTMFKTIWQTMNPGKTEDDFRTYLQTTSQTNIDTTAVLLRAQGYIETPPGSGNWSKPAA